MVPYDAIAIYIRREAELIPEYVNGDNYRLFSSLRIPVGQGLSGWVAHNRKPIINGNPSVEPGYLNDPSKFSTLRSALAVPLEGISGVIGVLALYRGERDAFTSDHLRILLAVSGKMALSIENALKYQQAEDSATTDYLTGLPNARSLFLQLDRELARCKRDNLALTVMVSDMDGFKQINDRFGHLEGNRVLRLFAQALKDGCREYDYVARMGGDEFVVIAPGLTADAAGMKAEQLRAMAQQAGNEVCGEDILSLSVGRALYPEDGNDAEQLLAEADRRMYLEKQKQLCLQGSSFASPPEVPGYDRNADAGRGNSPVCQPYRRQHGRLLHRNQHDSCRGQQNQAGILDGRCYFVGGGCGGAARSRPRSGHTIPRVEPGRSRADAQDSRIRPEDDYLL